MNPKSLPDVLHQVNTSDENDQEGLTEITPDEAEELTGGTGPNVSCPGSTGPNFSCPGNSSCPGPGGPGGPL